MNSRYALLACVLTTVAIASDGAQESDGSFQAPEVAAKDFLSGRTIQLSSLRGKPVVINFFFPGCPPCRWEAPAFQKFANKNRDIQVLAITNPDSAEEKVSVAKFVSVFGWKFPILLDEEYRITHAFDPDMAYPTTFLLNADGRVVGKIVNYLDWDTLEMKDVLMHLRSGKLVWYHRYLRRKK